MNTFLVINPFFSAFHGQVFIHATLCGYELQNDPSHIYMLMEKMLLNPSMITTAFEDVEDIAYVMSKDTAMLKKLKSK